MDASLLVKADLLHRLAAQALCASNDGPQDALRSTLEAVRRGAEAMLGELSAAAADAPTAGSGCRVVYLADRRGPRRVRPG